MPRRRTAYWSNMLSHSMTEAQIEPLLPFIKDMHKLYKLAYVLNASERGIIGLMSSNSTICRCY